MVAPRVSIACESTGQTKKEVLSIELDGKTSVMYRFVMAVCKPDMKKELVQGIVKFAIKDACVAATEHIGEKLGIKAKGVKIELIKKGENKWQKILKILKS